MAFRPEFKPEQIIHPELPDDRLMAGFVTFCKQYDFSAEQMRDAYLGFLGDEEAASRAVPGLLAKVWELSEQGLPASRFASLIDAKESYDHSPDDFVVYTDLLPIQPAERELLKSINAKRRRGTIECYVNHKNVADISTRDFGDEPEFFMADLVTGIEAVFDRFPKGTKFEIMFSED